MTPISNSDYFTNVAQSILDSVADALMCHNIDVPSRMFVGFDRPPQDICPELVSWVSNVRPWDGDFPDTRRSGNLQCFNMYAFDISIRIGRCYIESSDDGQPLDAETLQDWTAELNRDATAIYMGWINQWRAGNVTELTSYELVTVGSLIPYKDGGCAGWEFTITVGTV